MLNGRMLSTMELNLQPKEVVKFNSRQKMLCRRLIFLYCTPGVSQAPLGWQVTAWGRNACRATHYWTILTSTVHAATTTRCVYVHVTIRLFLQNHKLTCKSASGEGHVTEKKEKLAWCCIGVGVGMLLKTDSDRRGLLGLAWGL